VANASSPHVRSVDRESLDRERFERFLQSLLDAALDSDSLAEEDTPLGRLAREYFTANWIECRDGLLRRTTKIRVVPEPDPAPRAFWFEIDCRYKRKFDTSSVVEMMPGPVSGRILYRSDLFENPELPAVAVLIDRNLGYFHPNFSRQHGVLCLGDERNLPRGPLPLGPLLENHVYPIISYQNRHPAHPADLEAARYFALDPTAMDGLERVEPLY
jgi:hypothetical protein